MEPDGPIYNSGGVLVGWREADGTELNNFEAAQKGHTRIAIGGGYEINPDGPGSGNTDNPPVPRPIVGPGGVLIWDPNFGERGGWFQYRTGADGNLTTRQLTQQQADSILTPRPGDPSDPALPSANPGTFENIGTGTIWRFDQTENRFVDTHQPFERVGQGRAPFQTTILDNGQGFWAVTIDPATGNIVSSTQIDIPEARKETVRINTPNGPMSVTVSPETADVIRRELMLSGVISAETMLKVEAENDRFSQDIDLRRDQLSETHRANTATEEANMLGLALDLRGQNINARVAADSNLIALGHLDVSRAQQSLQSMVAGVNAELQEREQALRFQVPESQLVTRPNGETVARFRFPGIIDQLQRAGLGEFRLEDFDIAIQRVDPEATRERIVESGATDQGLFDETAERLLDTQEEFADLGVGFPEAVDSVNEAVVNPATGVSA